MDRLRTNIIIPVYNGSKTVSKTLSAVDRQTVPHSDFEVIVVDDGSTDDTAKTVKAFPFVRLLSQANAGPAVARNSGARAAKGDILVFLDADCVPRPDWLERMLKPFEGSAVVGAQGRYENPLPDWMARFVQLEIEERYARMEKRESIDFIGSYSAAYRRDVFLSEGGFDERFRTASGEDPDLSFRLANKGHKMVFCPEAVVAHFHPTSLKKYWRTKFYRAYWRVRMYAKNPAKMKGDSYTNPLLKFQMLCMGAAGLTLLFKSIGIVFGLSDSSTYIYWNLMILGLLALSVILTWPTVFFILRKDPWIGILSLFLLPINTFLFVCGYLYGEFRRVGDKR
jgi:cellulose synthase/poly-beta-1,6-N-acetylglucosamine synthase-like glycosyltransferase